VSRNALESKWVHKELEEALATPAVRGGLAIVPLLIDDCEIPPEIADRLAADFRQDFDTGLNQLMAVVGTRYNVDVGGRFQPGDSGDSPYFTEYGLDEERGPGKYRLQLDVISSDLETQHSVLSQFVFAGARPDAMESLGLAPEVSVKDVLLRTCAEDFAERKALITIKSGEPKKARFTIHGTDDKPSINVDMRVVWLGMPTRGVQILDIGGLFEQIVADRSTESHGRSERGDIIARPASSEAPPESASPPHG
jgi:hypothetical protein